MPVEVDLQTTGSPSGDAHIAKPKFFVDEVDVVMQAFANVRLQLQETCFVVLADLEATACVP